MTVNLSPKVRLAIYIIGSVGSLVAGYLFTKGYIGPEEVALWGGFVALAFGLAGLNTPTAKQVSTGGDDNPDDDIRPWKISHG